MFAIPALRTRGVNLAVITLAVAWAAQDMLFTNPSRLGRDRRGSKVGSAKLFGLDISGADQPARYAAFTFIVFVLCCIVVANLRRGRLGRRMIAVRSNERAAAASGVGVFQTKLVAFAISGALAGLAGVLISFQYQDADFVTFDPFTSLLTVAWIVIGGVGFVLGHGQPGRAARAGRAALADRVALAGVRQLAAARRRASAPCWPSASTRTASPATTSAACSKLGAKLDAAAPHRARRPPEFDIATEAAAPTRVRPRRLQIEDLTVRYGGVVAVDSISIEVEPGRGRRPDRPQRRRKDVADGRGLGLHAVPGPRAARRPADRRLARPPACRRRPGPLVPGTRAVPGDDRAREPPGAPGPARRLEHRDWSWCARRRQCCRR